MRIAMVGLGDIARKAYLPIVATHGDITPMICTRDTDVLRQVQRQYRISAAHTSLDQIVDARPDLAMVHASTESHYGIVKRLLQAGIPVFVDKPISYHFKDTAELIELAAQKQLPLMVGFNRRFAPLYQSFLSSPIRQVHYHKNRLNLPAKAREFILDDFIHVLDFVRFCTPGEPASPQIFSHSKGGLLTSVQVQWQCENALFVAAMNRQQGMNEERLSYISENEHWEINNLSAGVHYKDGGQQQLGFNDWQSTLEKRGFAAMIDNLLNVIRTGQGGDNYEDILATHKLCEDVLTNIKESTR